MLFVSTRLDTPARIRQTADLEQDRLIDWHKAPFYALATCENILGSLDAANLFRAAIKKRFAMETPHKTRLLQPWERIRLGYGADRILTEWMTPGHNASLLAVQLHEVTAPPRVHACRRRI